MRITIICSILALCVGCTTVNVYTDAPRETSVVIIKQSVKNPHNPYNKERK